MGTGVVSILLNTPPYNGKWLYYLCIIVSALNVAYLVMFLAISLLRYTLYPEMARIEPRPMSVQRIWTLPWELCAIMDQSLVHP